MAVSIILALCSSLRSACWSRNMCLLFTVVNRLIPWIDLKYTLVFSVENMSVDGSQNDPFPGHGGTEALYSMSLL